MLGLLVASAGIVSAAFPAFSQSYPARPIAMVVPFAVGGPTDTIARIMSERMAKALGQQVIVDNRGGGSFISAEVVARAPPDGYTLLFTDTSGWTSARGKS